MGSSTEKMPVGIRQKTRARHAAKCAFAQEATFNQPFADGERRLIAYPEKRPLIALTTRPPQLETPFEVLQRRPLDAKRCLLRSRSQRCHFDHDRRGQARDPVGRRCSGKAFQLSLADLKTKFRRSTDTRSASSSRDISARTGLSIYPPST